MPDADRRVIHRVTRSQHQAGERIEGYDYEGEDQDTHPDRAGEQAQAEGMEGGTSGMTKLVMKIRLDGCHLQCIRTDDKYNPFRVVKITTAHRRQIAKYGDFMSVICFLLDFYRAGMDTMPTNEVIRWAKENGSLF